MAYKTFAYLKALDKKRFILICQINLSINLSEQLDRLPRSLCGWRRKLLQNKQSK